MRETPYIVLEQSTRQPVLWYASLKWENNWNRPDFTQCTTNPDRSLELLISVLENNLGRLDKFGIGLQDIHNMRIERIPHV